MTSEHKDEMNKKQVAKYQARSEKKIAKRKKIDKANKERDKSYH